MLPGWGWLWCRLWFWNVSVDSGGTDARVAWTVNDGDGAALYPAVTKIFVPPGTEAYIAEKMTDNETLTIIADKELECSPGIIEIRAIVRVHNRIPDVDGEQVAVALVTDGKLVDKATGGLLD